MFKMDILAFCFAFNNRSLSTVYYKFIIFRDELLFKTMSKLFFIYFKRLK